MDIVKYLVKIGAELDKSDYEGTTPLYGAAYSGQLDSVRALVEAGADMNAKTKEDRTPLYIASQVSAPSAYI